MPKTTTPLPQLTADRVRQALSRVKGMVWTDTAYVEVQVGPLNRSFISLQEAKRQKMRPIKQGEYFAPQSWQQRWFKLHIPKSKPGESGRRYLRWQCTGETTVYIGNQPWAGLDPAHETCPLPDKPCWLWLDTGTYQTGIWVQGRPSVDRNGCRFDSASMSLRDESAWEAYYDLSVLLQLVVYHLRKIDRDQRGASYHPPLEDCPPVLRQLLKRLDDAVDRFDTDGLPAFLPELRQIYHDFPAESWGAKTGIMGHSHLDLVWLWPESVTYRKAVHTFATTLRLMEQYPDVVYSMSQPVVMSRVKTMAPKQYREIVSRIREGRWEATGGMDVEFDNQVPSGEALARALIYGQDRFKDLTGRYSSTGWLPDVFGYNQFLPQIFSLGGLSSFFTTKMTWSNISRFPHNSFIWQGPDGTEILTHLSPLGYNGQVSVAEIIGGMDAYRQSDVHDERLAPTGYGDGAGGLTEEHCERALRLKDLATVPKTEWTSAEAFFERLDGVRDQLPIYRGELYLEYHRGTYTTQSQLKQQYRRAERALQTYEAASVVSGKGPIARELWHRTIFSQFHDAIPGSSITKVYDDLVPELEGVGTHALASAGKTLKGSSRKRGITIFNPLAIPVNAVVEIPLPTPADGKPGTVTDRKGNPLPAQPSGDKMKGRSLVAIQLEGLESHALKIATSSHGTPKARAPKMSASSKVLSNGIVDARFTKSGQLEALSTSGGALQLRGPAGFAIHEDNPAAFDAWDVDYPATWLGTRACDPMPLRVIERGPVRVSLLGESTIGERSRLTVIYSLDAGSPLLKTTVDVDWQESHKLLRYMVPTDYTGVVARYGNPFGSIDRNQKPGDQKDAAQWEVPASRWMAVLDGQGRGLSIITEAKYGFSCRNGVAGVSLLRSPKSPDPVADMGRHRISFAIGRYRALTTESGLSTAAEAEAAYTRPLVASCDSEKDIPFRLLDTGGIVPAAVLPAEKGKGYVIRLHDTAGTAGHLDVRFPRAPRKVHLVDFLERPLEGRIERISSRIYRIYHRANQIVSVKVVMPD